jgi:hypothetical protein
MKPSLLFSLLAFSINAFAQINPPKDYLQIPTPNSFGIMNVGTKIKGNKEVNQRSLIQIYDSVYHWQWDTLNSIWEVQSKTIGLVYNTTNNLTNYTTQILNAGVWENSENYTATYDVNGNLTGRVTQTWHGAWLNVQKSIYIYDANNNQTGNVVQNWVGHSWINNQQSLYTYDADNNLINYLYQNWNGSIWINSSISSYSYDANNNLASELSQTWNGISWENSQQYIYNYNANNYMVSVLVQNWNGSAWADSHQSFYTYDADNNLVNVLSKNFEGNVWVNSSQSIYSFDINNNMTGIFGQTWNGNSWVNAWQFLYVYDINNFTTSYAYKYWDNTGNELMGGDSSYYYAHTIVGIKNLPIHDQNITISPNPNSGKFIISSNSFITSIEVFNLFGDRIYSDFNLNCQILKAIDMSNVPKGIYIAKVQSGKGMHSRKIVIH